MNRLAASAAGISELPTLPVSAYRILQETLTNVLSVLLGVGFGLLFLNTPVAIVVYFALPTGWGILTSSVHALHSTGNWLDTATAWDNLTNATMTSTTWAQVATATAVWVLLLLVAGTARVQRTAIS
jgi:ABC-2 type transport system permease protein